MCIFCLIASGEIPSYKVYEDNNILAFLDIKPISPGHTLVIPKKHYANLEEITETELASLIIAIKKVGRILKEKLDVEGYNLSENNDPVAGQEIPHLHFHLLPRQFNDGLRPWPSKEYGPGEAAEIIKKINS